MTAFLWSEAAPSGTSGPPFVGLEAVNRLLKSFEGWPGTVAVILAIVVGFVIRGGDQAGWPRPLLLVLALGIELPVLLWAGGHFLASRRSQHDDRP